MKTLLAQIGKEISKATKEINKIESKKNVLAAKGFNMTVAEGNAYTAANESLQRLEKIVNTLHNTRVSLEGLI